MLFCNFPMRKKSKRLLLGALSPIQDMNPNPEVNVINMWHVVTPVNRAASYT